MSESLSIHQISTTPIPFGVSIKWKWPEASHWFSGLELQYLLSDGQLVKELINWPVTEKHISGLKAGERLQVRLRPVSADGSARDWRISDWLGGVSSVDAGEIVEALQDDIRSSAAFAALHGDEGISPEEVRDAVGYIKRTRLAKELQKSMEEISPFAVKDGQVFIKDAFIGDGITSANYSVKVDVNDGGKRHAAGMAIDEQRKVEFKADRLKVHGANESHDPVPLKNKDGSFQYERCQDLPFSGFPAESGPFTLSVHPSATANELVLSEPMRKAVIKAVRENDLFQSPPAGLQQAMHEAVTEAIKNALKPGGLLYNR